MEQQSINERRRDPRIPRAFAFWIRPLGNMRRISAWMLDTSAGGAAFLVNPELAPPVGERIELIEMLSTDRDVREDAPSLPRFARVLRHDPPDGITRKVAVQFEADDAVPLDDFVARRAQAFRLKSRITPPPLPVTTPTPPATAATAGTTVISP